MSGEEPAEGTGDSFRTVARAVEAEIEAKRSRFRCVVARVSDEPAVRAVVEERRRVHGDARHHCSAFVLGPRGEVQRSSDDGEPSGTAGAPMLEVLRGAELTDVVAVVTRWFGGTLLGAGGLVRAYGDAVRAAVEAAEVMVCERRVEYAVTLGHADSARVESALRSRGVAVLGVDYAAETTLRVGVPPRDGERLGSWLAELTGGSAKPVRVGERWVDLPD